MNGELYREKERVDGQSTSWAERRLTASRPDPLLLLLGVLKLCVAAAMRCRAWSCEGAGRRKTFRVARRMDVGIFVCDDDDNKGRNSSVNVKLFSAVSVLVLYS